VSAADRRGLTLVIKMLTFRFLTALLNCYLTKGTLHFSIVF